MRLSSTTSRRMPWSAWLRVQAASTKGAAPDATAIASATASYSMEPVTGLTKKPSSACCWCSGAAFNTSRPLAVTMIMMGRGPSPNSLLNSPASVRPSMPGMSQSRKITSNFGGPSSIPRVTMASASSGPSAAKASQPKACSMPVMICWATRLSSTTSALRLCRALRSLGAKSTGTTVGTRMGMRK